MNTANRDDIQNLLRPNQVDMSQLPSPQVVETLSFETIFQELLADFRSRKPDYDTLLESDPVIIALECAAYRELLWRQRVNEAAKANMLAYATGSDLDNLAAFYGIARMSDEDDTRLRQRTNLALEGITTAGSENAYLFHTLSADTTVKSAGISSPEPGKVRVSILSTEGDGTASSTLIQTVSDYLGHEDRRPLTDQVVVRSAEIVNFAIKANIYVFPGPSAPITEEEIRANLNVYLTKQNNIGSVVALSGIYDALHTEGVQKVSLIAPTQDIITTKEQAAFCNNIELNVHIVNDSH